MDHDENLKSNVVNEHTSHTEVNGYGVTTKLTAESSRLTLEDKNIKRVLTFTIEKEGDFTEQEIRFFENGLRKSVSFFDPNIKKPSPDRFNNRYNNSQPRYNNNSGNSFNQRRYSPSNPHPNYKNRYGGWDDDIN